MNDETKQHISGIPKPFAEKLDRTKQSVFARFPLLFTLLGTFGFVATLFGFEGIINRVEIFRENPFILLGVGLLILVITGTLYKKLD